MAGPSRKYLGEIVDVKPEYRLDPARLTQFFGDRVKGFAGPIDLRQFEGGFSNPTYFVETPQRRYVLRKKPAGALIKSAHAVDREFRVMSALHNADFPVPEPLAFCDDETILGTPFYVMSYVQGRVFFDCTMPDLSPADRAEVFDQCNAAIARLHSFDYAALGLGDFGRPGNYFTRQINLWSKQYIAARTEEIPEMEKLLTWLPTAIPDDDTTCLVHGDYSFHNILYHPTEPRILAVLDWELSTLGHPFGDLFYNGMDWFRPAGLGLRGSLQGQDLAALGVPTLDQYVATYCDRTNTKPPEHTGFYKAYMLFRMAAIGQGIVARAAAGTGINPAAAEHGRRVQPLAKAAWYHAQEAGAL